MYYIALSIFVLLLVQVQFRYCAAVTICALKLFETFVIVGFIELYRQTNGFNLSTNSTLFEGFVDTFELFSTAKFAQFRKESL